MCYSTKFPLLIHCQSSRVTNSQAGYNLSDSRS